MKHVLPPAAPSRTPFGVGLRSPHLEQVSRERPAVDFFEVHPENLILDKSTLEKIVSLRADYPLSLHAVGLSLGSVEGVDETHLAALRDLVATLDPFLVSDHLSWSTVNGVFLNDLLPLPYTRETLDVFARNVDQVQNALARPILIENPSAYIRFRRNEFEESEFLRQLVARTGCRLLLDVNNLFVTAANLGLDSRRYLRSFPMEAVREIHLAGHQKNDCDGETILIDDHGSMVSSPVWALYAMAIANTKDAATLIEWDSNIPAFDVLLDQRDRAVAVARSVLAPVPVMGLGELQTTMARMLLSGNSIEADLDCVGHISVHRNNIRESLTEALRAIYPAVEELVGKPFFRQTALSFIENNPPSIPPLAAYGEKFAEFLERLPSCQSIPYLGDIARLEWCASRGSLHGFRTPLAAERLGVHADGNSERIRFASQDGISYLRSDYPIDQIWNFARAGGKGAAPKLDGGPVFLEISPGEDGITLRRLEEPEFTFRQTLCVGADLGTAADAAVGVDPLFVLFAALRSALDDRIFTDCHIGQSQFEEVSSCQC